MQKRGCELSVEKSAQARPPACGVEGKSEYNSTSTAAPQKFNPARAVELRTVRAGTMPPGPSAAAKIAGAFNEAAEAGVLEPEEVERVAALLLGGVLTDAMLDIIIDLTDGVAEIDVGRGARAERSSRFASGL